MKTHYPIIIVGGGPVGAAMAIELGMQGVETLVLEKYAEPLLSPRAQYLNERSLNFFTRWHLLDELKAAKILDSNIPSATAWQENPLSKPLAVGKVDESSLRIPLYITENVMRKKISTLKSVNFLTNMDVRNIKQTQNKTIINARNKNKNEKPINFTADYVLACDGANSLIRKNLEIPFVAMGPKKQILSVLFKAPELKESIKDIYMMHLCLTANGTAAVGPINLNEGIWYAQIPYPDDSLPTDTQTHQLLEGLIGLNFDCEIFSHHFWEMQVQLAERFSEDQRIFLVGDSAHAFAPTGGLGLNTALVDAINLAWKLAGVVKNEHSKEILQTYELERRPAAIRNLHAAEQNAQDRMGAQNQISKLAQIADKQVNAAGITKGYAYFFSGLTKLENLQSLQPMPQDEYQAVAAPGYFLPEIDVNGESIYKHLSAKTWNLIIVGNKVLNGPQLTNVNIVRVPENSYPHSYILLRPDWHISQVFKKLPYHLRLPFTESEQVCGEQQHITPKIKFL